jgi:two-component system, NtrC family, sensor kinase
MSDYTVLVVDDEVNVQKSLRRLFVDTDYKVLVANSGLEGMACLDKEPVHLVISDYRMPEMNGVEFLSKVKAEHPDTVRIILSGFADVEAVVDAINQGEIYKFLAKPWNDQELLSTVKRALEHSFLQRENVTLLRELRSTNAELTKLAEDLESKVQERTRDLERKSRAVSIAHSILDLLPVGVIGMDSDDTIVYMNGTLGRFVDTSGIELGRQASEVLDPQVYAVMKETMMTGRSAGAEYEKQPGVGIVSTPLSRQSGAVALMGYVCVERYREAANNEPTETTATAGAEHGG